jgi:hypothetical protein
MLTACGPSDEPCSPPDCAASTYSPDGGTIGVHAGRALDCPDSDPMCDPYPPVDEDGGGGGGEQPVGAALVTISVINADSGPRTFNGTYIIRDPSGAIVHRNWFLPAIDLQANETRQVIADLPVTHSLGVGISGYWLAGGGSYWARYEDDYSAVAPRSYNCVVRYWSEGGQGYISATGCP